MNHTDLDHRLTVLCEHLIIAAMTPVIQQPGKRPFHSPTAEKHLEPRPSFVDHFQSDFVRLLHAPDPLPQPLGPIAAINPELAQTFDPRGPIALDHDHQSHAVLRAGRGHYHRQQQPEGIDQQMSLASFDLLIAVEPHCRPLGGSLDALTIDTAGGGLGWAPLAPALLLAQLLQQVSPEACTPPRAEVAIDRIPVAKIYRQHAPLTAALRDVENAVKHAPQLIGLAARPT